MSDAGMRDGGTAPAGRTPRLEELLEAISADFGRASTDDDKRLAADSWFNARVSMAAWSLRMNGDDGVTNNSSHMGDQDAKDLGLTLAAELSALYPKA